MRTQSTRPQKNCVVCGSLFTQHAKSESLTQWNKRQTCSQPCRFTHFAQRRHEETLKRRYTDAPPGVVPLGDGTFAYVDPEDDPIVRQHVWRPRKAKNTTYAATAIRRPDGRQTSLALHQLLIPVAPGNEVDHQDGDGLNCRRSNLREATRAQNHANRRKRAGCISRFKGVTRHKDTWKWRASIKVNRVSYDLGGFESEEAAARAYDAAAFAAHGPYARLNFPEEYRS